MLIKDPRVTFPEADIDRLRAVRFAISLLPDRVELDPRSDKESDLLYGWAYYGMLTWALGHTFGLKIGLVTDTGTAINGKTETRIEDLTFCLITETESAIIVALPGTFGGPGMFHETLSLYDSQLFTAISTDQVEMMNLPDWYRRGISDLVEAISTRLKRVQSPPVDFPRLGEQGQPL